MIEIIIESMRRQCGLYNIIKTKQLSEEEYNAHPKANTEEYTRVGIC